MALFYLLAKISDVVQNVLAALFHIFGLFYVSICVLVRFKPVSPI